MGIKGAPFFLPILPDTCGPPAIFLSVEPFRSFVIGRKAILELVDHGISGTLDIRRSASEGFF
jgi:hypothetical protein